MRQHASNDAAAFWVWMERTRRLRALVLALGLAVAATAPIVEAQKKPSPHADYALIFGTVWGPDDRPVAGVPIRIRRADEKKARWQLVSDRRGEFAQRVPTGKAEYVVWADIKVPKGQPKPEARVHIENDERTDIGLHLSR